MRFAGLTVHFQPLRSRLSPGHAPGGTPMATAAPAPFSDWLGHAQVPEQRLTSARRALLNAVFHFRQDRGTDYYSTRLLSHFLRHCGTGLKVAQLARLVGISRPTASRQQGDSSKQAIQQA